MSRRSIFLLSAGVVLLYFSIILFMLNPLHGSRRMYYGNTYMNHLSRPVLNINWCKELQYRAPPSSSTAALVSYPGSGNTWLRYLLQQATGIYTGSIYMDYGLKIHGFPAENVTDGSVLVVKTHEGITYDDGTYKSAVLLIRNPRDAILADYNRLHKGHIGVAPKSAFEYKPNGQKGWSSYVSKQLNTWKSLHMQWLTRFRGPIHIVFYEVLTRDTRRTIEGILRFLNHSFIQEDINCTMTNKEGIYRRRKKQDFDPYTEDMYKSIEEVKNIVLNVVAAYQRTHAATTTEENKLSIRKRNLRFKKNKIHKKANIGL